MDYILKVKYKCKLFNNIFLTQEDSIIIYDNRDIIVTNQDGDKMPISTFCIYNCAEFEKNECFGLISESYVKKVSDDKCEMVNWYIQSFDSEE